MAPHVALALCFGLAAVLFVLDRRWRPTLSTATWIPFMWVVIIGSRPLTLWIWPLNEQDPNLLMEGSPIDRAFYLALILLGVAVLLGRRTECGRLIKENKLLLLYFGYLAASAIWSDYTLISLKRWIKDFGNVVMVLVLLTERNPLAAAQALLVRAACVLIPLSIVMVKYFPEYGRYFDWWTGRSYYSGVGTNKNMLGMTLTVLALGLAWALMEALAERQMRRSGSQAASMRHQSRVSGDGRGQPREGPGGLELTVYLALLGMTGWLLRLADCATAMACIAVGVGILIALRSRWIRENFGAFVLLGAMSAVVVFLFDLKPLVTRLITDLLGRDSTLTGRDDIWEAVLREDTNPIIGVGAYSFWMGDRIARVSEGWTHAMNEAHNGYLETYLNVGLVGVGLFLVMMGSAIRDALRKLKDSEQERSEGFRLALLIAALLYNVTEAVINRLDMVWFGLLIVILMGGLKMQEGRAPRRDPAAQQRTQPLGRAALH
jgi:O-antigen ligase